MNKLTFNISAISVCLLLFIVGIINLFHLRFSQGDLYPVYSSLRPDPLGCKALFDAYSENGSVCSRNYSQVKDIADSNGVLLIRAGMSHNWRISDDRQVLRFVLAGGTFAGFYDSMPGSSVPPSRQKCSECEPSEDKKDNEEDDSTESAVEGEAAAREAVACGFSFERRSEGADTSALPSRDYSPAAGFPPLMLNSDSVLSPDENARWQTIYYTAKGPVGVACKFGKGTVFLFSCSYPVSNEGLKLYNNAHLLSHVAQGCGRIVFDEHHLGVEESRNIAWLLRKYKAGLLLANLAFIAVLFLWRNSLALENVPVQHEDTHVSSAAPASAQSAFSGLRSLVSSGIPSSSLLDNCMAEWLKSARSRRFDEETIRQVMHIYDNNKGGPPLVVYRKISGVLRERKRGWRK